MNTIFRMFFLIIMYFSTSVFAMEIKDELVIIKAGEVGSKSGVSYKIPLKKSVQSINLFYDLKIVDNYDSLTRKKRKVTGKLPGLSGGQNPNTGGLRNPDNLDRGWSIRPIYRGNYLKLYLYDLQMPDLKWGKKKVYGKDLGLNIVPLRLKSGEKYRLKLFVKVNDIGHSNGVVKLWVNDNLSAEYKGIKFRNESIKSGNIDEIRYSVFNGGGKGFELDNDISISISNLHTK